MTFSKAAIARAVDKALPEGTSVSDDALFAFNECCADFVSMVASEASESGGGKFMSYKHVVQAMKKLGLDTYLEQAEALAAQDAKELGATKKRMGKPARTQEERDAAAKRQRELLEATAENFRREQGL